MRFFTLWLGEPLSLYEELCFKSFLSANQELIVYCDKPEMLPAYLTKINIRNVIDCGKIYERHNSYASFANYFRYLALNSFESEGVWVDSDVVFKNGFEKREGYVFGIESKKVVNNAVLAAPARSKLLELLISGSTSIEGTWGSTGPMLLTKLVKDLNLLTLAETESKFYAISPWSLELLFNPKFREQSENLTSNSSLIHLYNELIIRSVVPKNCLPPKGSFMWKLFINNGFNPSTHTTLDATWLRGWQTNYLKLQSIHSLSKYLGPSKSFFRKQFLG
jgi:hypothetical protein